MGDNGEPLSRLQDVSSLTIEDADVHRELPDVLWSDNTRARGALQQSTEFAAAEAFELMQGWKGHSKNTRG